jgi:argininosuccinate lyase
MCPLGVEALAGNHFGIDRELLPSTLGFSHIHPNSLTAVADRDFVVNSLQWSSLMMAHLKPPERRLDYILHCRVRLRYRRRRVQYR